MEFFPYLCSEIKNMTIDYSIYDQNLLGKAKKLATFEAIAAKRRLSYKQINIFELLAKVREYFGGWKEREAESCEFLSLDAEKHKPVGFSFIDEFRMDESWLEPIEFDTDSLYEISRLCEAWKVREKQSIRRYLLYQNYIDGCVLFSRHHDLRPVRKIRKVRCRSSCIQYQAAHYYIYDQCDSQDDIDNNMTNRLVNGQKTGHIINCTRKMAA